MAEARLGHRPEIEAEIEALVASVGGRRLEVMDPWDAIPKLVRKVRGKADSPPGDLFELPAELFEGTR